MCGMFLCNVFRGVAGQRPAEGVAEDRACAGWSEGETSPPQKNTSSLTDNTQKHAA
jgi:hypothetical protein